MHSANQLLAALLTTGIIAILILCVQGSETPSSLVPCMLHDPNNGPCLKDLWQNILINGIKDVPGVKWISLDPYKVKRVRIAVDTPLVSLNMELTKITITGLPQSTVLDVRASNGEIFNLNVKIPEIHIKGDYAMKGRALVLNLDGKGPFEMVLDDIELGLKLKTKAVERDGEYYLEPIALKTDVKHVGNIHVQFDNLFGNNPALTDSANVVFNQNWNQLIELMLPIIAEAMDISLTGQAKKYLGRLPARIAFSDVP